MKNDIKKEKMNIKQLEIKGFIIKYIVQKMILKNITVIVIIISGNLR
jgi:hypothetical protein